MVGRDRWVRSRCADGGDCWATRNERRHTAPPLFEIARDFRGGGRIGIGTLREIAWLWKTGELHIVRPIEGNPFKTGSVARSRQISTPAVEQIPRVSIVSSDPLGFPWWSNDQRTSMQTLIVNQTPGGSMSRVYSAERPLRSFTLPSSV